MALWDWKVTKTSFARLDMDLKQLAASDFDIYQIVAVQEVKPAKIPFEIVVISRKALSKAGDLEPVSAPFAMNYHPPAAE